MTENRQQRRPQQFNRQSDINPGNMRKTFDVVDKELRTLRKQYADLLTLYNALNERVTALE